MKYEELKKLVLERIPESFKTDVIEEETYDATLLPINFDPYKMEGAYYPTFFEFTPKDGGPVFYMSKGEETTVNIWAAILRYEEYDLLADLLILGFFHDSCKFWKQSIARLICSEKEAIRIWEKARDILEENGYGRHHHRCGTYLTIGQSNVYHDYLGKELKIESLEKFADIMMEIISDAYSPYRYIVKWPSEESIKYAESVYKRGQDRLFEMAMSAKSQEELWK